MFKNIHKVEIDDLNHLLKTYVMPLFTDSHSYCIVISNPSKLESVLDKFSKNFVFKSIQLFL
jgi:hypothetical protein